MIGKKYLTVLSLSGIVTACIVTINFVFFMGEPTIFSTINVIAILIFVSPIAGIKYLEYRRIKEIEEMFPVFLRDFVESVRGGMTIPNAFKSVCENDYKALTPYIKKMHMQMDWGIPVEKVLIKFSKESKSKLIGRIISSVVESHRFGGSLADSLEALSKTSLEVERLRAERRLYLHSQMLTGYIIFFVFLAVIISLNKFLIPSLTEFAPAGIGVGPSPANLIDEYNAVFRNLILIQGLFAGLAVGKMAEGAIVAGMKHSLFMMFVGLLAFIMAG